jgi:dTDP-4-amino-4,6-dideoxygalactose transaminase
MIPYGKQNVSNLDIEEVVKVLKGDWLSTGPAIEQFEKDLEDFTGGTPTVVVSSGTAALHSAYTAAGIQPGDEVITPSNTFIATQAAAAMCGAKIVFADISMDTGNIDPVQIETKITSRTAAVVAVDYAGHPADLNEIRKICDKHKILFIEDASHSLGSIYYGEPVGKIADLTTFSFFPTKNITTGEGGAVSSQNKNLLKKVKIFSRQGLIRTSQDFKLEPDGPWHQEVHEFGVNYRLTDFQAALGSSQLKRMGEFKTRRQEMHNLYNSRLKELEFIQLPTAKGQVSPFWHLFSVLVPEKSRRDLYNYLRKLEVNVQVNYFPAHLHPVFKNQIDYPLENTVNFYKRQISLPLYIGLTDDEINQISDLILGFYL